MLAWREREREKYQVGTARELQLGDNLHVMALGGRDREKEREVIKVTHKREWERGRKREMNSTYIVISNR